MAERPKLFDQAITFADAVYDLTELLRKRPPELRYRGYPIAQKGAGDETQWFGLTITPEPDEIIWGVFYPGETKPFKPINGPDVVGQLGEFLNMPTSGDATIMLLREAAAKLQDSLRRI